MIKPLTLCHRLLERADASDEDCRTDDGDIMREADEALNAKDAEIAKLREAQKRLVAVGNSVLSEAPAEATDWLNVTLDEIRQALADLKGLDHA